LQQRHGGFATASKRLLASLEKTMRTFPSLILLALCSMAFTSAIASDSASFSGVLVHKNQQTVVDTSTNPSATTVGEFFRNIPRGAPGRMPMMPTKEVAILKVRKADGEKIEIQQDWNDSRNLTVGDDVLVKQVDGVARVVRTDTAIK
jgi:hypothetical protein